MDTWTDEKLVKALDEAIERQGRTEWPEITPKIEMTDQGLISVKFSSEVFFPSYMLEEFEDSSEVDSGRIL